MKFSKHYKIKAVGFDFDDTLISTENKKYKLLEDAINKNFGTKNGIKKEYIKLRGKYNRIQKIEIILTKLLKRKPTKKEIQAVSKEFSKNYKSLLSNCPLFECTNILKELKKQVNFLFLISLEKKGDVREVAKHCGIGKYFNEILGGPKSKLQNLKHVLKKHKLKPGQVIYIGDLKNDIIVSKKLKLKAVGIHKNFTHRKLLKKLGADFTFSNLCEVPFSRLIKS